MLIAIGKCHRKYLYILYSALIRFLSITLLGSNSNNKDFGVFGFAPIFSQFNFIQSIIIYFGYIIFGLILLFFKNIKKEEQKKLKINTSQNEDTFIYNDPSYIDEKKLYKIIILVSISFILYEEIKKVLYKEGFQFFDFWTIEIVFLLLLMKKYFIIAFYLHHKVSIIFIVSACSILLLIASFLPSSLPGKNSENAYQNIKNKLGRYFYCILFIILFVCLSFFWSYSRTYIKVLMEIKFISPFKIIIFIGIAGFPISIITSIVSYYIGYRDNMFSYFSSMKTVLNGEKYYKFWVEIFCVYLFYSFTNFMEMTFNTLTIYYMNPFYVLMTNNLYYFISGLISFCLNPSSDGLKLAHFLIAEFTEILACLGYMVYLEILQLNFCGLSDRIGEKLSKKGDLEFRRTSAIYLRENDQDEILEDETSKSSDQFSQNI